MDTTFPVVTQIMAATFLVVKRKTTTTTRCILVNKEAFASIGHISSKGGVLANKGATSSSFILIQSFYSHLTQPTYQEQTQQRKSNIPNSIHVLPTNEMRKGILSTAPTPIQSSVHLHYILSLIFSGTSTISAKFHQALQTQIGF